MFFEMETPTNIDFAGYGADENTPYTYSSSISARQSTRNIRKNVFNFHCYY